MTAIKQLREWFNGDKRPEVSAWITGDTVETRAILELAERLDKPEGKQGAATENPPEPFEIKGPGRYRMRNGGQAEVERDDGSEQDCWPWIGQINCVQELWNADGTYIDPHRPHEKDIVSGPLTDEPQPQPEMAGLMAEMLHVLKGVRPLVLKGTTEFQTEEEAISTTWLGHLDAAITKASAIVNPEPKRETRKVWLNLYEQSIYVFHDRETADSTASDARLACLETEITFTHGQGLETGQ